MRENKAVFKHQVDSCCCVNPNTKDALYFSQNR